MDMLNADLQLKNDASPRKKSKPKGSDEDDAGFHFIAFVPVQGKVWKLDGLQRQPQSLGMSGGGPAQEVISRLTRSGPITSKDWVMQVAPEIASRMAQYEDGQIEFAILGLVKEPLTRLVAALAENVKSITSISQRLDQINCDWRGLLSDSSGGDSPAEHNVVVGPSKQYGLDQDVIDRAVPCHTLGVQLGSDNVPDLLAARQELVTAQAGLKGSIRDEAVAIQADNERAASRRNDKGLLAKGLLQVLERMGKSRSILECAEFI